jgi:hypothetical protein
MKKPKVTRTKRNAVRSLPTVLDYENLTSDGLKAEFSFNDHPEHPNTVFLTFKGRLPAAFATDFITAVQKLWAEKAAAKP